MLFANPWRVQSRFLGHGLVYIHPFHLTLLTLGYNVFLCTFVRFPLLGNWGEKMSQRLWYWSGFGRCRFHSLSLHSLLVTKYHMIKPFRKWSLARMAQKLQKNRHLQKVQNILRQLVVKLQVCGLPRGLQSLCVCTWLSGLFSCSVNNEAGHF